MPFRSIIPDDSRPYSTEQMEQPVFSPELQSERMREIQEAAVYMTAFIEMYVRINGDMSLDDMWVLIHKCNPVENYLSLAGDTLGRPFVKQAFSMAIRNYINSKE